MIAMSGALLALAIWNQSLIMLAFALMGAQSLFRAEQIARFQRPMGFARGAWAAAAYLVTLVTFGLTGWPLLAGFF
jgi:hypothetical protein